MTPNLLLATQKAFSPHKWFKTPKSERSVRQTAFWAEGPVPGLYEYIPGRGKYLIATLADASTDASQEFIHLEQPVPIVYSRAIRRWFLEPEYKLRKKHGMIKNERGKNVQVGFFRTDDHAGIAWVQCWDEEGTFIPGPYQKWCIDAETKQFRHMRHRDDPDYVRSRNNSSERDADIHSQDSMSIRYRGSRPNSSRNVPSTPSTRPGSIILSNAGSKTPSQHPSRQNSPQRNTSVTLEGTKAALRRMAREQQEAVARLQAQSKERSEQVERGRPLVRTGN